MRSVLSKATASDEASCRPAVHLSAIVVRDSGLGVVVVWDSVAHAAAAACHLVAMNALLTVSAGLFQLFIQSSR